MKTTYELGKIDFDNRGRKINRASITFNDHSDIRPCGFEYGMPTFRVGNGHDTDIITAGPCNFFDGENTPLDDFPEIRDNPYYRLACYFADKYGLKYLRLWEPQDRKLFVALCRGV